MNITQIAKRLKVSKSTISRELSRNCIVNKGYNKTCLYSKTHVVCNTCPKKGCCSYTRKFYNFEHADMLAKERSSGSRSFARINPNDLKFVNLIVSNGVNLGQSIHHVYNANPCLKDICCERTIRRYVYKRLLDVKAYDLRRFIRFKHEYKRKDISAGNRDLSYLIDRSYKDFVKMTSAHKSFSIVEFDSVIGKIDDKQAILTITLKKENFQFGILIRKGNSNDVAKKVRLLFRRLGSKMANKYLEFVFVTTEQSSLILLKLN